MERRLKVHIDEGLMFINNTIADKHKELEESFVGIQTMTKEGLSRNIVDSNHKLFVDICNENHKSIQLLKNKYNFYTKVIIGIQVVTIVVLLLTR